MTGLFPFFIYIRVLSSFLFVIVVVQSTPPKSSSQGESLTPHLLIPSHRILAFPPKKKDQPNFFVVAFLLLLCCYCWYNSFTRFFRLYNVIYMHHNHRRLNHVIPFPPPLLLSLLFRKLEVVHLHNSSWRSGVTLSVFVFVHETGTFNFFLASMTNMVMVCLC